MDQKRRLSHILLPMPAAATEKDSQHNGPTSRTRGGGRRRRCRVMSGNGHGGAGPAPAPRGPAARTSRPSLMHTRGSPWVHMRVTQAPTHIPRCRAAQCSGHTASQQDRGLGAGPHLNRRSEACTTAPAWEAPMHRPDACSPIDTRPAVHQRHPVSQLPQPPGRRLRHTGRGNAAAADGLSAHGRSCGSVAASAAAPVCMYRMRYMHVTARDTCTGMSPHERWESLCPPGTCRAHPYRVRPCATHTAQQSA